MRTFIAIDGQHEDYFSDLQNKIKHKSNRMNFPKVFHITLKFIGEVTKDQVEEITEKLSTISFPEFQIKTKDIGIFPNVQNMRVIWVGINDQPILMKLQEEIQKAIGSYATDTKDFIPHITLARIKSIEHKKAFKDMIKNVKVKPLTIKINKFKLIKSTITSEGSVYEDLAVFPSTP